MGAVLFRHNQEAYEAALAMLARTGRAAVIHPTGTGKSFIAFQLCAEHPHAVICWLSPSEYIFRTQLENWCAANHTEESVSSDMSMDEGRESMAVRSARALPNIRFLTYARLMLMQEEELTEIQPDYIILDEFHRCGAKMWGQGVHRLLLKYPDIPVLGLSATNIRYLDGQRNMADELFDGNIASEMTLGDAIVRGILNPPKYVLSMYSCQKEFERYRARTKGVKSSAVRTEADRYLEALKRALEKSEGLEEIFRKHIEDRNGKYLVFCADYEHMQEMIEKAPEWFSKVDQAPHIYSVYSEDTQAKKEFERFKADTGDHIKLLFCIDMLNEGVHLDDVSGVILLRPTVSPIIYKQQIGRALSAGKKKTAVIFDIVMNIENLYSIGTIEDEIQAAVRYYRDLGEKELIINEHFQITDEVQDCRKLFRKLNETLGASWELMYRAAERYFEEHGNLEIKKRYVTEDGYSLGQWLDTQRKVRAGKVKGILTEDQIARLDKLGMCWQGRNDRNWMRNFAAAQSYYQEHGNLLVNVRDGKYCGVELGKWLAQLRTYKKSGIRESYLTPERIKDLEKIGMIWDVPDYLWEQNYHAAVQYHREHGNLDVPCYYVDLDGVRLGAWIANIRFARRNNGSGRAELTEEQIARLDELGMIWENRNNAIWEKSFIAACRYRKQYGNLNIPAAYVTEDGLHLGRWIRRQRDSLTAKMSEERRKKLKEIGINK